MKKLNEIQRNDWNNYHDRIGMWCEFLKGDTVYRAEITSEMLNQIGKEPFKGGTPVTVDEVILAALEYAEPCPLHPTEQGTEG